MPRTPSSVVVLSGVAALLIAGCTLLDRAPPAPTPIERLAYRGWSDALRLQNEHVEAVILPEVGRVLSFRFRDGENVFWEDPSLAGRRGDASGKEWINFGGDKTWPAPEAEWKNYTKYKEWMPPPAFDALPVTARAENGAIVLTSPVDPFYGIRTMRRVALQPNAPVMTIETSYERVSGDATQIAIWVITQFKDPVAVYVPVPKASMFAHGHYAFRDTPWPQLTTVADGTLKVTRDPQASHKLGSDADRMLWVGQSAMCLVSAPRAAGAVYPDRGASAEVYTNPDPKAYVELETLGPLALMKPGDRITRSNSYTLVRRMSLDPDADARRVLVK